MRTVNVLARLCKCADSPEQLLFTRIPYLRDRNVSSHSKFHFCISIYFISFNNFYLNYFFNYFYLFKIIHFKHTVRQSLVCHLNLFMRIVNVLARLCKCAGSPEHSLFTRAPYLQGRFFSPHFQFLFFLFLYLFLFIKLNCIIYLYFSIIYIYIYF